MSAIFLDRDGVIIRKAADGEYITEWSEVEFLTGALEAIAALGRQGYKVFIVTNQRGVATGKIKREKLAEIHTKLRAAVGCGPGISEIYCCTHDISERCECRKPKPGMLLRAAQEHHLQLSRCWMIGDSESDIAAGKSVGCKTGLVTQTLEFQKWANSPDIWGDSLKMVVQHVVQLRMGVSRVYE